MYLGIDLFVSIRLWDCRGSYARLRRFCVICINGTSLVLSIYQRGALYEHGDVLVAEECAMLILK